MPLQATSGAASYDAFGGGVPVVPTYIEDVFSTWLYTGNGSTQTINNGIDIAGKGALVWTKCRNDGVLTHRLNDTERGITNRLFSNLTNAQSASATSITATSSTGYTVGSENGFNENTKTFASWTFREQAKFFDVVTYTGNGANPRAIPHSLASVPGCIIIKRYSDIEDWYVYHRSLATSYYLKLNTTDAQINNTTGKPWNTTPTSTEFYVGGSFGQNITGETYVAYLFAHDAGGFGLTGTDNVISCGSYAGNGSGSGSNTVNLGYEPQYLMVKRSSGGVGSWWVIDNMRGATADGNDALLAANTSAAEVADQKIAFTATGFTLYDSSSEFNASGSTYIYIAIRRGPMKTPTSGTSVFKAMYGTGGTPSFTTTFPVDLMMDGQVASTWNGYTGSRLQGGNLMYTNSSAAETSSFAANITYDYSYGWGTSAFNSSHLSYMWGRAPGFMDVVCYTGTGSNTTQSHNLSVAPEMMIVKSRNGADSWIVYHSTLGATKYVLLDGTGAAVTDSKMWNNTAPTASVFSLGASPGTATNLSGTTYVAYLFATVAGVSKVGSYTGTGTTLQINCGFTAGARFVMIRRTSTGGGDWYVWDSARGIVAGNDPYLLLNSTAAQVTNTDYIDTYNAGFEISSTAPAAINANGGTFIFLAIA